MTPATAGPTRIPRPSAQPEATLALVSSAGTSARLGRSEACAGRVRDVARTATSGTPWPPGAGALAGGGGPVAERVRAGPPYAPPSIVVRDGRPPILAASGASMAGGPSCAGETAPASAAPPRSNAYTRI